MDGYDTTEAKAADTGLLVAALAPFSYMVGASTRPLLTLT
jgi:hypothetical protein